jgi:hypothetical protein
MAIHRFLSSGKDVDETEEKGPKEDGKDHSDWFLSKRQREFRDED